MAVFIDIQGFRGFNNEFIPKELAVLYSEQDEYQHFLIEPPFAKGELSLKLQRQTTWLTTHFHGLRWEAGTTSLESLKQFLTLNLHGKIILVKGLEKMCYLENLLELKSGNPFIAIKNIESYKCYNSLQQLKKFSEDGGYEFSCCKHHVRNCALQNVYLIKNYMYQLS